MNRTDQAPEPTMEEILASIRLIISDDVKKATPAGEEHPSRPVPPRSGAAPLDALPGEDVLDLTEALAFPEDRPMPRGPKEQQSSTPANGIPATQQPGASAEEPEDAADLPPPEDAQAPAETRQDIPHAPAPASRSMWSRRETPLSHQSGAAPAHRYEPPSRQPQRNWAQDIQMPIPSQGPVSLIPAQVQSPDRESGDADQDLAREAENEAGEQHGLGEQNEAAVAAIAASLPRPADRAMATDGLETADDVDFLELRENQKAEVTESFVDSIQRENTPRDMRPLPTLLDEVFRQDFIRQTSRETEPAEEESKPDETLVEERETTAKHGGLGRASESASHPEQAVPMRAEPSPRASEALPVQVQAPAKTPPVPAERVESPAVVRSPLEDAVRDMLRPLLVQWLDEHMPRVLENTIREEIAARELSPKTKK